MGTVRRSVCVFMAARRTFLSCARMCVTSVLCFRQLQLMLKVWRRPNTAQKRVFLQQPGGIQVPKHTPHPSPSLPSTPPGIETGLLALLIPPLNPPPPLN